MKFLPIIYLLILTIFGLIAFAIMQINLAGIKVKDFYSFIKATQDLDRLYRFSKIYEKMNPQQQIIFLAEAERLFNAFDKIPSEVWEEEQTKYDKILETYRNIRMLRWSENV